MIASACICNRPAPNASNQNALKYEEEQVPSASTLKLRGFGLEVPILTSKGQLDGHVGRVVAVRGTIENTKIPRIIGVEVSGGHNLDDAFAVGFLAMYATTEEVWEEEKRNRTRPIAESFGPVKRFTLYESMTGTIARAREWGAGYTEDPANVELAQ